MRGATKITAPKKKWHLSRLLRVGFTVALISSTAQSAISTKSIGVTVNLDLRTARIPSTGLCQTTPGRSAFGATVTIVCATGAFVDISPISRGMPWLPTHGGAYRYVTQVSGIEGYLGTVDIYSGIGTITELRVVSNGNRDYIEMTVGW